jgi:hypothetical protein
MNNSEGGCGCGCLTLILIIACLVMCSNDKKQDKEIQDLKQTIEQSK